MKLFDSHAHYFDSRFEEADVPYGSVDGLLLHLFENGAVDRIINVGTDIPSSLRAIAQAGRFSGNMYAAAGIHPSDARHYPDMETELQKLRELLLKNKNCVVAIGEIGLDYHYPESDKVQQKDYFYAQLSMAKELDLPVIIHDREAHGDCFQAVCMYPGVRGVFHSYSGSEEMAHDLIRRGFYISFSGTVTFKNAMKVAAVASSIPRDRILIETDCPYLAPHPYRGQLNHSGLLLKTAEKLGELWGVSCEEVATITYENATRLFLNKI